MVENQETLQSNTQVATVSAEEPAQSPVERVTDPKQNVKDKKKSGSKAKQERLLEQLRAAKESFRPPAGEASIPPKGADSKDQEHTDKRPEHNCEGLTHWTPWIIGACLTGGALMFLRNTQIQQTRSPASVAAGPVDSAPKQPVDKPPGAKQLEANPDPFYMQ